MRKISVLLSLALLLAACKQEWSLELELHPTFKYKMGKMEVIQMADSETKVGTNILAVPNPAEYNGVMPFPGNVNSTNTFLVRSDAMKYLFDTGMNQILQYSLNTYGESYGSIETIFLTHMHMDHIGGLVKDDKAAFPNAKIYVSKAELEYWTSDANLEANKNRPTPFLKARQVVELYKDRLIVIEPASIEAGGTEVAAGITAFAAPGHTPGHTIYLVGTGDKKILIWGDITHLTQIQVSYPEVSVKYDVDPKLAAATRASVLKYAADNEIPVAGMHILYPGIGHIIEKDGKYIFKPLKGKKRNYQKLLA